MFKHLFFTINLIVTQVIEQDIWQKLFPSNTTSASLDITNFNYNQLSGSVLHINPSTPFGRHLHTAITYTTFNTSQSNNMCPGPQCGPNCDSTDQNCIVTDVMPIGYYPTTSAIPRGNVSLRSDSPSCPPNCCGNSSNNEWCLRNYDNTGNQILPNQEIMLVFGGISIYDNSKFLLYDNCESMLSNSTSYQNVIPDSLLYSCGEIVLNELWGYNINNKSWFYIKPDISQNISNSIQIPYPRYGHAAAYAESVTRGIPVSLNILRKYMYVYGGFSIYCTAACNDLWRYEIAYGPQYMYPNANTSFWNRGNNWVLANNASLSPGNRFKHSMIIDYSYSYIYLFGGIKYSNRSYLLMNDLWRFSLSKNVWEQIDTQGIDSVNRTICLWDGSRYFVTLDPAQREDSDTLNWVFQSTAKTKNTSFPSPRASTSIIFIGTPPIYIFLFGGYTKSPISTSTTQFLQSSLNDTWVLSLQTLQWYQIFPNSPINPSKRYGASVNIADNSKFKVLLYGGMSSGVIYNDLWSYNLQTDMWTQIISSDNIISKPTPTPLRYSTMTRFSQGILLYGGSYWQNSSVANFIAMNQASDSVSTFQNTQRQTYISNDLWVLWSNCTCQNQGLCNYGRCICNSNYFGSQCQFKMCPNSFCYTDEDTFDSQVCYHCSGNGDCINGICNCSKNYAGDDCSILDCPNNCSNRGVCVRTPPISQCYCDPYQKCGGNDCSVIYCLNDCSGNGICKKGVCECNANYFGDDCSVLLFNINRASTTIQSNTVSQVATAENTNTNTVQNTVPNSGSSSNNVNTGSN